MEDDRRAGWGKRGDLLTTDLVDRDAARVCFGALLGTELGHKPFQIRSRSRAGIDREPGCGRVQRVEDRAMAGDWRAGDDRVDAPGAGDHAGLAGRDHAGSQRAGVDIEHTADYWRA